MKENYFVTKIILGLLVICAAAYILLINDNIFDTTGLVFIAYPLFTYITSIIMQLLIKRKIIVIGIIFIAYLIATFTFFDSILIYCISYTIIAILGTFTADLFLKCSKRFTK